MPTFKNALLKGLAILLPALITIAVFAWGWGVIRDYAVVAIIKVIDTIEVFPAPDSLLATSDDLAVAREVAAEPAAREGQRVVWRTPDETIYIQDRQTFRYNNGGAESRPMADGERLPPDMQKAGRYVLKEHVLLIPGRSYSGLGIMSSYLKQHRGYNYSSGEVTSYTTSEYILAVVLSIALIILIGIFARGFFGRQITNLVDNLLKRIPIVNLVYPYAKQVVDFIFSEEKPVEFDAVVAVEWPREGCWQLGFVTGNGLKSMEEKVGVSHTTVFVPMSPIPMTGFTVFVPREQVMEVDISVEEACMIILSGGVLAPPDQTGDRGSRVSEAWHKHIGQARTERARSTASISKKDLEAMLPQNDSGNSDQSGKGHGV